MRVLFNPSMPATGWNHQSLQVVRWEEDLAGASRRRIMQMAAIVGASLVLTVGLNVALRRGIRRRSQGLDGSFSADTGGGAPHVGVPVAAMGLLFLLGQLTGGGVAPAGFVLGALLAGGGGWLMRRQYLSAGRHDSRIVRGTHVLGFTTTATSLEIEPGDTIVLHGERAPWLLSLRRGDDEHELARTSDLAAARRWGAALAEGAGTPWRVEVAETTPEKTPLFSLPTTETGRLGLVLFVAILLAGSWWAWHTWQRPDVRERVALAVLDPLGGSIEYHRVPAVRLWAARELAAQQSPAALLGLIRLLNTIDPQADPEFAAAALEALGMAAGLDAASGEWHERLARANRWVAERVDRSVDGHDGVLGWFPVAPEFQRLVEAMGGGTPYDGWSAWSGFGAGTLTSPEAFLYAAGSALADPRPIAFAIRRTSAPGAPLDFEGQPDPPQGEVLVRTVGEAMALHLSQYLTVDTNTLSDDFRVWWSEYARRRLLPPMP
ncbi:MAG: hypothetical protein H0X67_14555 [Acidobacteria bacterium]|nr:hypothetical protein [Acidobacteriota bacterium]